MSSALSRNIGWSALLATSVALLGVACASNDGEARPDGNLSDAGVRSDGGDVPIDEPDANEDTPDAAPQTCSADNVCHTVLPRDSFLRDVWSAGDGIVWAVGWNEPTNRLPKGNIFRWDGAAWSVVFETESRLNAVWGSGPTDLWVGGDDGLFHGTGASSSTITWTKVRSGPIASIWGSSANDIWAVGAPWLFPYSYEGTVLHFQGPSTDGGDGWEIDPITSRPAAIRKVWGTSASDVWLGANEDNQCATYFCQGPRGFVLHRQPDGAGGFTWSETSMPDFGAVGTFGKGSEISGAGSIGPDNVWLLGNRSEGVNGSDVLFRGAAKTDGSGDFEWSEGTFGTCRDGKGCYGLWFSRAVWGKNPNDVYLAGDFGQLRHWNGTDFSLVKTTISKIPLNASLFAMWGSSDTDLWIVGDRIALHKVAPNP